MRFFAFSTKTTINPNTRKIAKSRQTEQFQAADGGPLDVVGAGADG